MTASCDRSLHRTRIDIAPVTPYVGAIDFWATHIVQA